MHKSNELLEAAEILFVEMQKLGIESLTAGYVLIDEEGKNGLNYTPDPSTKKILPLPIIIPHNETIHLLQVVENWKKGNPFFIVEMDEDETIKHQTFIAERSTNFPLNPAQLIAISPAELFLHNFYFKEGYVLTVGGTKLSVEQTAIMLRFTKVFQQTYTRFLDLQKAEAQTRESQIELSLERVRAKTMAMHNSTDVGETAAVMVDELQKLGIETIRCGIGIMHEPGDMEVWTISTDESYKTTIIIGWLDMNMHPLLHGAFQSWRKKVESYSYELKEADLLNYYNAINNYPGYPIRYDTANLPKQIHHNEFHFTEGTLFAFSLQQLTETQRKIFKRFAGVFGQTYRRYLDLKKAEAQARQAKIEAAMEKVRARAMAMQKPDELVEVAELLRREMGLLGVEELETSSIYIHHEETGKTACWYAIKDVQHPEKELVSDHMTIELDKTCVGKQMLAFYLSGQQQVSIPMQGDIRKEWINYCAAHSAVLEGFYGDSIPDRTYHLYKFSNGYMGAASPGDISAESWDLLRRATLVFSLAYTRFNDLQQAEAQAREAKIETALERVRSRTLAMQKSDDLVETAAEVFRQLISLGIEPNRLYIGIVKEESGDMEMWATDEDGKHAGKKFMFNKNKNVSVKKLFDGWKAKEKSVKVDMQGIELEDYFHYLNNVMHIPFKGGLTQKRRVQSVAYFSKGFIGMASPDGQGEETIQLLERFAAVFNLSFTRFNDLKIAEAHAQQAEQDLIAIKEAKQKAEEALTELQATQKQLIQSEKMASLGELTAGIAHEIQNPLNFVNNFSEVSNELMDEMNAEIEKGDMEEARAIANEIKQNLEKINHHGKRADAIVKGMLQHSRSSSASKEPTDINRLADEYLRLAYHGLRAKDKSFNATLKTDFDETAGNINIVPQDIGRVILNLITNAFFATNERRKLLAMGYEPLVAISTKKMGNKIEISVRDNGGGIPQNIVDKIFQPFFTTKPTGQGTGLGLSLAYDIVKAHGGEMKVETKEGEGSEFMMTIPAIKTD
jgi:signal transduction histidine kinase